MPKKYDYGRESAAFFAALLVFLLGFVGVMFMVVTLTEDPFWPLILTTASFVVVFGVLAASLWPRDDSGSSLALWSKAKTPEQPLEYSPKRVRTSSSQSENTNRPPTADGVRDIKEARESSANTWVPSSVPKQNR